MGRSLEREEEEEEGEEEGSSAAAKGRAPTCRLLFLRLKAHNERERFAFCSVKGCERIKIKALIPKNAGVSDCTATAYPRFAERPVVDVPMPRKLLGAQLVSGRGGREAPSRASAWPPGRCWVWGPGTRGGRPPSQPRSWLPRPNSHAPLCLFSRRRRTASWR